MKMINNNTNKFERATVVFAPGLEVDGYQTPSGEYRIGVTGASKLLGFSKEWLGRVATRSGQTLEVLQSRGFDGEIITGYVKTESGDKQVQTISTQDFQVLLNYAASIGNEKALNLLGITLNKARARKEKTEESVKNNLVSILKNVKTEVVCPVGRIDILTDNEIIEIKNICDWKHAIGQILVYGHYYPTKSKRIHLFGNYIGINKKTIIKHAHLLNISVSFD